MMHSKIRVDILIKICVYWRLCFNKLQSNLYILSHEDVVFMKMLIEQ